MNHVSLKDVAARAGVAFPTMRKVLKGKGTASSETRFAILQAAEELGDGPNAFVNYNDISFFVHIFPSLTMMHNPFLNIGKPQYGFCTIRSYTRRQCPQRLCPAAVLIVSAFMGIQLMNTIASHTDFTITIDPS